MSESHQVSIIPQENYSQTEIARKIGEYFDEKGYKFEGKKILLKPSFVFPVRGKHRIEATLATNIPIGYRCKWVYLKHENSGNCLFTTKIPKGKVMHIPVAHGEGRFLFAKEKEKRYLEKLYENDQLVFRYCNKDGEYADGEFPVNPNGAFHDIAGICNPAGTVFGLMPHPERAYYGWQLPDWTKTESVPTFGDGKLVFESMIEYLKKKF